MMKERKDQEKIDEKEKMIELNKGELIKGRDRREED